MAETTFLDNLKKLGLSDYEARGYLALMERKSLTATEISAVSGIPRTKVYDVSESLMKKGLASLKPGRYKKYSAADIETFKNKLTIESQRRYREEIRRIEKTTLSLKRKMESIYSHQEQISDPLEYIEIIRDPAMAAQRFLGLREKAKQEEIAFVKGPFTGDKEKLREQVKAQCEKFRRRHLKARAIYEIGNEHDKWQLHLIDIAVKNGGEEARILRELPLKACIFDRKVVLLSLQDPVKQKESFTTLVIEHPNLAISLTMLFDFLWEIASDYSSLREPGTYLK
jgi:sugar-specific transcriptional regulator TrmB